MGGRFSKKCFVFSSLLLFFSALESARGQVMVGSLALPGGSVTATSRALVK